MKRDIGDIVRINPYSGTTGVILYRRDSEKDKCGRFDYRVKLNIPEVNEFTKYTFNYDKEQGHWWQFFNDDELDALEINYKMVTKSKDKEEKL